MWIQVKVSEYKCIMKCMWVDSSIIGYTITIYVINMTCSICMLAYSSYRREESSVRNRSISYRACANHASMLQVSWCLAKRVQTIKFLAIWNSAWYFNSCFSWRKYKNFVKLYEMLSIIEKRRTKVARSDCWVTVINPTEDRTLLVSYKKVKATYGTYHGNVMRSCPLFHESEQLIIKLRDHFGSVRCRYPRLGIVMCKQPYNLPFLKKIAVSKYKKAILKWCTTARNWERLIYVFPV